METATRNFEGADSNAVTEDMIPERRLWTAVLVNAVLEWRNGTLRAKREAQKFLFESDGDFQDVCARAGLNPASFRTRLLQIGKRVEMQGPLFHPIAA
jgi:hypothetical protein